MRAKIIDAALKLARAAHYTNAGTAEFLVEDDNFYFLEVNARLQVEHPVTEMRFGCDLVCEQLRIASGGKVSEPAAPRGAAIECRINAEDPEHDFRPATGTVLHLSVPGGPGVRFDSHMTRGAEVTPWYDGLLGKLVCYGANREEARGRLVNALGEFALLGVTNNAAYLRDIVASEQFRDAKLSTHFIDAILFAMEDQCTPKSMRRLSRPRSPPADRQPEGAASRAGAGRRSPWDGLNNFELWGSRR